MAEEYPIARLLLAPEYRTASPERIEDVLATSFPGMAPEDAENFLRGFGRAFQSVGQTIAQRAPGILSGAVQGATTGAAAGPWGALGGALVGGTVGGLTHGGARAPAARPPAPAAGGAPSRGPAPRPAAAPDAAVQQLMALLAQPQTFQAVLAAAMGNAGRPTLPAGRTAVPTASVLGALGTLATRAAEELGSARGESEGVPAYLMDAEGGYAADPADPDARARRLLGVLAHANEHMLEDFEDFEDYEAFDEYDEYDELYEDDDEPDGDDGGGDGGDYDRGPAPYPQRRWTPAAPVRNYRRRARPRRQVGRRRSR